MDVFQGIRNVVSTAAFTANAINTTKGIKNEIEALTSQDDAKRKLANNRVFCLAQYKWQNFKTAFWIFIAPLLLLFIIIASTSYYYKFNHPDDPQMKNKKDNIYITSFIIFCISYLALGGTPYLVYLSSVKWPYVTYQINKSDTITAETCSQYY